MKNKAAEEAESKEMTRTKSSFFSKLTGSGMQNCFAVDGLRDVDCKLRNILLSLRSPFPSSGQRAFSGTARDSEEGLPVQAVLLATLEATLVYPRREIPLLLRITV